jgi:hypothetical protein
MVTFTGFYRKRSRRWVGNPQFTYFKEDRFAPSIATATVASEQIRMSRVKPLRGAEGALDILIFAVVALAAVVAA